MTALYGWLPTIFAIAVYACSIKAAARLYRQSTVVWKHAFAFSTIAIPVCAAAAAVGLGIGHPALGLLFGPGLLVALGGWFLGSRARSVAGIPVRFGGGAAITAVAAALALAIAGVLAAVFMPLLR